MSLTHKDSPINAAQVLLDAWERFIKSEGREALQEYVDFRVSKLNRLIAQLGAEPGLDSSMKIHALLARINELQNLGKEISWQGEQVGKSKIENPEA